MGIKVLELFAGSRSIGKVCDEKGVEVFSTDLYDFENINLKQDILELQTDSFPFIPDVIWASPPCTTYSIAAIWRHRKNGKPISDAAKLGDKIMLHTLNLIQKFKELNPALIFFIENPRGMLRKMDFMQDIGTRYTVTYCQYGDNRMKPTDIWTNSKSWKPRPMCKNGAPCHEPSPRGSNGGTQGKRSPYERSKIPYELCKEIVESFFE